MDIVSVDYGEKAVAAAGGVLGLPVAGGAVIERCADVGFQAVELLDERGSVDADGGSVGVRADFPSWVRRHLQN